MPSRSQPVSSFHGITVPLVTPLTAKGTLDEVGLQRLIEHVIAGGVTGIFILGTTGEGPSLSYRLRREVITQACECVAKRARVMVGISDTAYEESLDLALIASEAGADAVVLAPPYYLPPSQHELTHYVRRMAAELPLPLMLYNMPQLTKVWYDFNTLEQLAEIDSIIGMKDSSGDMGYFAHLVGMLEQRPDWTLLVGPEHRLIESLRLGGHGGVNGGANVLPRLFVEAYHAELAGDTQRTDQLQQTIVRLQAMYEIGDDASRHIRATKAALASLGICGDTPAAPLQQLNSNQRDQVEDSLRACMRDLSPAGV